MDDPHKAEIEHLRQACRDASQRLLKIICDETTYRVEGVLLGDLDHIRLDLLLAPEKANRRA